MKVMSTMAENTKAPSASFSGRAGAGLLAVALFAAVFAAADRAWAQDGLDSTIPGGITVSNEDITDVLTLLAQFSGLTILPTREVAGKVTFAFQQDVSVRQVLDSILPNYGWCYAFDEATGVVSVGTNCGPTEIFQPFTRSFNLRYTSPDRVLPIIQPRLSENGTVTVVPGTRRILVTDKVEVVADIEKLLEDLDQERVTHIFDLKYINVDEAREALDGIISAEHGDIQVKPEIGRLIVTDIEENIRKAIAIIEVLDVDPLVTMIFPISFALPEDIVSAIEPILTPDAYIFVDTRSSRIIVRDIPSKVAIAAEIIEALDVPPLQVFVQGELFSIRDGDLFELGVEWEAGRQVSEEISSGSAPARLLPNALASVFSGGTLNLSYLDPGDFGILINAIRQNSKTTTLLSPRIIVSNDETANIHEGTREPYTVRSRSNTVDGDDFISQRTQQVGVSLTIEPHITESGYVDILVELEDSDTLPARNSATEELLRTRETRAESVVTVKSGRTIVLGGVIRRQHQVSRDGVPFLSQIPLIGMLFRNKSESENVSKLILFITPHIVSVDDPYRVAFTDEYNWRRRLTEGYEGWKDGSRPVDYMQGLQGMTLDGVPGTFTDPAPLPPEVIEYIEQYRQANPPTFGTELPAPLEPGSWTGENEAGASEMEMPATDDTEAEVLEGASE